MSTDANSPLEPAARRDIWSLPSVVNVRVLRVRYREPRRHVVDAAVVEYPVGVEVVIETDGDIPMRALSPALHIGSAEVAENERVSETVHRFFVLDERAVEPGDPITLGWAGMPGADAATEFRYQPPGEAVDEPPR